MFNLVHPWAPQHAARRFLLQIQMKYGHVYSSSSAELWLYSSYYQSEMSKVKQTSLAPFLKKASDAATRSAAEGSKIPESARLLLFKEWKMQQQPRNTKDVSNQSGRSRSAGQLITPRLVSRKHTVVPYVVPAVWSIFLAGHGLTEKLEYYHLLLLSLFCTAGLLSTAPWQFWILVSMKTFPTVK